MAKQEGQNPEDGLTPELSLLLDAIRREFDAKLNNLKLWGTIGLFGGGGVGGIVSRIVWPQQTHAALDAVVTFLT